MNLQTRQVRLYFPYYNRVRVLTDETLDDVFEIFRSWIMEEPHFHPIYGVIQYPEDNRWIVEHSFNTEQLNTIFTHN